jgi:hypothetical protein
MAKEIIEKTSAELQASIISRFEIIEETLPRLSAILKDMPLFWLSSISLNLISFLDYCNTVEAKYAKEILSK